MRRGPNWLNTINPFKWESFYIVSVDVCSSSTLHTRLTRKATPQVMGIVRDSLYKWGIKCNGFLLHWAADGGAFLFYAGHNPEYAQLEALRFALGARYTSWRGHFKYDSLYEIAKKINDLLNSDKSDTDLQSKYKKEASKLRSNFINKIVRSTLRTFPEGYDFYSSPAPNLPENWTADFAVHRTAGLTFRIVCHSGTLFLNPKDPEVVFGSDLTYLLKYERELGIPNGITATSSFNPVETLSQWFNTSKEIVIPREISRGKAITAWIHPVRLSLDLDVHVHSGLAAAHFETTKLDDNEMNENRLVHRIRHFFNKMNGTRADVYNIGLGTFANNLLDLWYWLLTKPVTIRVLLLDKFHDPQMKAQKARPDTMKYLEKTLREGLTQVDQNFKEPVKKILRDRECIKFNRIPRETAINYDPHGNGFGPYFGCSLYYTNDVNFPVEGSNIFITAPYSQWDNNGGYWSYRRVLYFTDVHAHQYLQTLGGYFDTLWRQSEPVIPQIN